MKPIVLVVLTCWVICFSSQAQTIRFEKESLKVVFAKAKQQGKPVFLLLSSPPPSASLSPEMRKLRTESGLTAPAVATALNTGFLNKELAFGSAESAAVVRKYTVSQWPTYLYFSPDGNLLYRSLASSSNPERYLKDLRAVQEAQASSQSLSAFQTRFEQGNRSADFLKQYISKQRELGQLVEPELLDAYVQQLPVSAFSRADDVLFILENGPVVGSRAQQLTRLNQKLYDSLYRVLPSAQRKAINNRIISNTMTQAIATKDRNLASRGAEFARGSWSNNYQQGSNAYETNMMRFLSAIKDTAGYLHMAVSYYDRKNASVSPDSARRAVAASQAFRKAQDETRQRLAKSLPPPSKTTLDMRTTTTMRATPASGPPAYFLQDLNNGAWMMYQTGTHNGQYLWRALQWSKRTVDLDPAAHNYDTLAHLLYRLRFFSEAVAMQEQAVAAARQEKASTDGFEHELEKIKKHTL
jgi:hypothetical protein